MEMLDYRVIKNAGGVFYPEKRGFGLRRYHFIHGKVIIDGILYRAVALRMGDKLYFVEIGEDGKDRAAFFKSMYASGYEEKKKVRRKFAFVLDVLVLLLCANVATMAFMTYKSTGDLLYILIVIISFIIAKHFF